MRSNLPLIGLQAIILCVGLISCAPSDPTYPNAHLLMSADEFHKASTASRTIVIDTRQDFDAFREAHIPGAIYFHARRDMVDTEHPVRHFMVGPEQFQTMMQSLGVNSDTRVLIYDEGNALGAARLFYGLEYYGHTGGIAILNGGFASWQSAELPVNSLEPESPISFGSRLGDFQSRVQESRQCDITYITGEVIGNPNKIVFDARSEEEFTGDDVRAERGGHIPGAVNLEWRKVLSDGDIPYFLPFEEIRDLYASLGITPDKEVIPHCHTNVRGSHAYFTLRLMGYDSVRPFEGSWEEYGNSAAPLGNL